MPSERIRVVCECGWSGRRAEAGGECPYCGKRVRAAPKRAPSPKRGRRVRRVIHVLPATDRKYPTATDLVRVIEGT